jgi:hypothetical protein
MNGSSRETNRASRRPPAPERNGSSRRLGHAPNGSSRPETSGSSPALVSGCGSALARRVPLRVGRNARPVSPGPSGPTRGQAGAPAGRQPPAGTVPAGRCRRPRTNELDPGRPRAGWYSRRVRASAERGRVQGPGRAEADLGPRTLSDTLFPSTIQSRSPGRSIAISRPLGVPRMGPRRGPLIPPLMGPPTPPLMGPPGGGGPVGAGLGPFSLVRRSAGQGHAQKPRVTLPRYAT